MTAVLGEVAKQAAISKASEKAAGAGKPPPAAGGGSPAPKLKLPKAGGGLGSGSKVLVAEFIACMVLYGLGPLLGQVDSPGAWLKKGAAVTGLFLVLALIASGGPKAARIAAAFGGLCTLALAINDRELFGAIVNLLGAGGGDIDAEDLGAEGEAGGE